MNGLDTVEISIPHESVASVYYSLPAQDSNLLQMLDKFSVFYV